MSKPPLRQRLIARLRGPGAWRTWLGLALLAAFTAFALYRLLQYDLRTIDIPALLSRMTPRSIGLAAAVYLVATALAVLGWGLILGALSDLWAWVEHARIYCVTQLARRLPGTYWYVLGRVFMYEQLGVARGVTALGGGLELAATCVGGLAVMLVTWPLVLGRQSLSPIWLLLALALLAGLLNPPAVRWVVRKFSPHTPHVRYRHILLWSFMYALIWLLGGLLLYVLSVAVHPALSLADLPAVIGICAVAGMAAMTIFSFLPLGLGATELTIAALLGGLLPQDEALFVAFALRAVATICDLLFGLAGLIFTLPGLHARVGGTENQSGLPHSDAEKPEGVFEPGAVVPRKEARFGGK